MVASAALATALLTYAFNLRKSKTDLFISIHEKLIAPETQEGRKHLKAISSFSAVEELKRKGRFATVNSALALYETLAMYASRGSISDKDLDATWGRAIHERQDQIRVFIDYREEEDGYRSWPNLTKLVDRLEKLHARQVEV